MAQAEAQGLPVYLLTGFLGSGKTTLLSRAVHTARFADTAVIINEFGEVGLDHILVGQSSDADVVLLDSGCLCCASNGLLAESLETLYYRRVRGDVPAFSRVIVETSGLADPGPLVNALSADPLIAKHYRFAGVVTAVDAVHGLQTLDAYREAATQAALADRIALTKTDLASGTASDAVCGELAQRNATASIHRFDAHSSADAAAALFDDLQWQGNVDAVNGDSQARMPGSGGSPLSHVFRYGIASYVVRHPQTVSWPQYAAWVRVMQLEMGERLLRAKGILRFPDGDLHAIHGVHHLFSAPAPLLARIPERQQGVLVLIAQDTSRDEIDACMAALSAGGNGGD